MKKALERDSPRRDEAVVRFLLEQSIAGFIPCERTRCRETISIKIINPALRVGSEWMAKLPYHFMNRTCYLNYSTRKAIIKALLGAFSSIHKFIESELFMLC